MGILHITALKIYCFAAVLLLVGMIAAPFAHAGSYEVAAHVDFPAPTQAAVIDPTLDTQTATNAFFKISGTCEIADPYIVISIVRDSGIIGSTNCKSDGTFALNVSLVSGPNILTARSASVSHLYGPDSQPVTITLNLPPPVTPTPETTPDVQTPTDTSKTNEEAASSPATLTEEQNNAINEGARENLRITTSDPFSIIDDKEDNIATIEVFIGGGRSPYTVTVNWGDGSVESKVVDTPTKYTFKHTYKKPATYHVTGEVRDVLGAVTRFEYVTTTGKPEKQSIAGTTPASAFKPKESVNYLTGIMISSFSLVGITSFLLGRMVPSPHLQSVQRAAKKRR